MDARCCLVRLAALPVSCTARDSARDTCTGISHKLKVMNVYIVVARHAPLAERCGRKMDQSQRNIILNKQPDRLLRPARSARLGFHDRHTSRVYYVGQARRPLRTGDLFSCNWWTWNYTQFDCLCSASMFSFSVLTSGRTLAFCSSFERLVCNYVFEYFRHCWMLKSISGKKQVALHSGRFCFWVWLLSK